MKAEIIMIRPGSVPNQSDEEMLNFLINELASLGIQVQESIVMDDASENLVTHFKKTKKQLDLMIINGTSTDIKSTKTTLSKQLSLPLENLTEHFYHYKGTSYLFLPEPLEELKTIFSKMLPFLIDDKSLPLVVKNLLAKQGKKITAAESLTGGSFLKEISSQDGASTVLEGGIVTYSNRVKHEVLGVHQETIDQYGVVSAECAVEMAEKSMEMFEADMSISLTGVAGPSSLEGKKPGTVWIGIAEKGKKTFAKKFQFGNQREENRKASVQSALNLVLFTLLEKEITNKVFYHEKD